MMVRRKCCGKLKWDSEARDSRQRALDDYYEGSGLMAAVPQPPPTQGQVDVVDYVLEDIKARVQMGLDKYGTKLQTRNGRDALQDAYQEAIDLVMYLRQAILERDNG